MKPLIGITADNRDNTATSGRYESPLSYSRAVQHAGGVPMILPHLPERAPEMLRHLDGLVLTGGVDPRTEAFGEPTHPKAKPMDPTRQAFELALLAELDRLHEAGEPEPAALGVCLGFQLMALHHGGRLHQHLPETLGHETAKRHQDDALHAIQWDAAAQAASPLSEQLAGTADHTVVSWHKQAVAHAGQMRVMAHAPENSGSVIEAAYLPGRPFYVGIQWHAERNADPASDAINQGIYDALVSAALAAAKSRARMRSR